MQDFSTQNDIDREYFKKDFSQVNLLLQRVRKSIISGVPVSLEGLDLSDVISYLPSESLTYITLFQAGSKFIRYGSKRSNLTETLNRDIEMLRKHKRFAEFDLDNPDKCRIMLEYIVDRRKTDINKLNSIYFNSDRFEIGINGLELKHNGTSYYYMPTDAVSLNHLSISSVLQTLVKKTPIAKLTNKISERLKLLKNSKDYDLFLFRSRAFITYKDTCIPLYRGNILYENFSYDVLREQMLKSADWLIANMNDDGKFLYYYDCCDDTLKDHEHPSRPLDNLYYNDLRHCGGIITLVRAFEISAENKYILSAKKAIDWSISILKNHDTAWGNGCYAFCNNKAKLGGTGVLLAALMQYRIFSKDKSYDEYIKGCVRHLLSRITPEGEFLGYYIHPDYNDGNPLIKMSDEERRKTFSFYYPGEALFGLALFANNFIDDRELIDVTKNISEIALNWIIDVRPKVYSDLFTALPSDAWLMQAVEEWVKLDEFKKENYINFVYVDAAKMIEKMYKRNDSPYIDYEGGYYYIYGDHYYPDGARSEGLIAAYYLAHYLKNKNFADDILNACKLAAKSQFSLFNSEIYCYSHMNPEKSAHAFRFKATRQWVRVDSIQHVACFFARLYKTENQ